MSDVKKMAEITKKMTEVSKKLDTAKRELKLREGMLASDVTSSRLAIDVKSKANEVQSLSSELEHLQREFRIVK